MDRYEARSKAQSFLARLSPYLDPPDASKSEAKLRRALDLLLNLQLEVEDLKPALQTLEETDHDLANTTDRAIDQLPGVIEDHRRLLGILAPGDPRGLPDLERLKDQLAEREAREELGVPHDPIPHVLEETTGTPNWGAAAFTGLFSLGWNAFTLFHATLMIGGMWKAFGPVALLLLLFYAIFFAVGIAMAGATVSMASTERIRLDGRKLTVIKEFLGFKREKTYDLAGSEPVIGKVDQPMRNRNATPQRGVLLEDAQGKSIAIGTNASEVLRERLSRQVGAYLQANSDEVPTSVG